jgi:hypothetical protein
MNTYFTTVIAIAAAALGGCTSKDSVTLYRVEDGVTRRVATFNDPGPLAATINKVWCQDIAKLRLTPLGSGELHPGEPRLTITYYCE